MPDRMIFGPAAAAIVALAAYRLRTLTISGALAAFVAGTVAIAAGWSWGFLLLGLFIAASVLSKLGERKKAALLGAIVEKGGSRDALQVAANGAVYVAAALAFAAGGGQRWQMLAIGALAASTADTWSTEIGTLGGITPRLIVSGKRVRPGTSGGLTVAGSLGALVGAIAAAVAARLAGWPVSFIAVVAGGIAGALGDSLMGATLQSRRWCERCNAATERPVHDCGVKTVNCGGLSWLDNDWVNFVSTIIGGLVVLLAAGF